ncbi:MAG TPA: tetratricopeptide repeat protein [Verrucomicrobiae bacterium]|nr:tetratricopeptide repeat protein [Verrucomicrobiae bacterium]
MKSPPSDGGNIQQPKSDSKHPTSDIQHPKRGKEFMGTGRPHSIPALDSRLSTFDYLLALLFFALSLMSKPMLVTLPFVLLLFDAWPLRRMQFFGTALANSMNDVAPRPSRRIADLIVEKLPFLGLSLASCVLTWKAQEDTMRTWIELPPGVRFANAVVSYFRYIAKTFWPADLSIIYPYQHHWAMGLVVAASLGLAALTTVFALLWRRWPYLAIGWLFFVGTLVPVIGFVQVGGQSMADRYMYLPSIGLFVVLVWGVADVARASRPLRKLAPVLGIAVVAACAIFSSRQLKYWSDGERLFRHALDVTGDNYIACECLYKTLESKGEKEPAFQFAAAAVRIEPRDPLAHYNLGTALIDRGRIDEAIDQFKIAVRQHPGMAEAENNWGRALLDEGRTSEAEVHIKKAFGLQPDNPEICYNLGMLLLKQSRGIEALERFSQPLEVKPDYADALAEQVFSQMDAGKLGQAAARFHDESFSRPGDAQAHLNWGLVLLEQGRTDEAEKEFSEAIRLHPRDARSQCRLAVALIRQRKAAEAVVHYRAAVRLRPLYTGALNGLAWILATSPDPRLRDGPEALRLARQACDATGHGQAGLLITLAAAYAETGQFDTARDVISQAQALASKSGARDIETRAGQLLNLFNSRRTVAQALQ